MSPQLLPARMLFRFAIPCVHRELDWGPDGLELDAACRLPSLIELEGRPAFAELRAAWSAAGLGFSLRLQGKRQPPWCRDTRIDESDGLRLWIDTRATLNVHRASRYCHQFVCLPSGGGRTLGEPVAEQLLINRAKENAKPVRPGTLKIRSERRVDGYRLAVFIPAAALTGYESLEAPRLGFTYAVYDRELGEQALTSDRSLPYGEDPSLWAVLDLVR